MGLDWTARGSRIAGHDGVGGDRMSDRISFAQSVLAAIYASPFMVLSLMAAGKDWRPGADLSRFIGPFILTMLLFWIPTAFSNLVSRALVGWLGHGLSGPIFHWGMGVVAGVVLIAVIRFVAHGTAAIGGGQLGLKMHIALVLASACNAVMIWAVWHFGWKSTYD